MLHLLLTYLLFVPSPEDASLLRAVPADVQLVISVPDVRGLKKAAKESAWGRFLSDPAMEPYCDYLCEILQTSELWDEKNKVMSPEFLFDAAESSAIFVRIVENRTDVGLLLAISEDRDRFDEFYGALKENTRQKEGYSERIDDCNDTELFIFEPREEMDEPFLMMTEMERSAFFLLVDGHEEEHDPLEGAFSILEALEGEGNLISVLDAPRFQAAQAKLASTCQGLFWFDIAAVVEQMKEDLTPLLGFDDFTSFCCGLTFGEDEKIDFTAFLGLEGEGFMRDLLEQISDASPTELFDLMPQDAIGGGTVFMDLNGIYKRILEEIFIQSEGMHDQFRSLYEEMVKKQLRIDPEKEILEMLDGCWGFVNLEVPEEEKTAVAALGGYSAENYPGFVYLIGVKDSTLFQKNWEKLLRATGVYVSMKKEDFQGQRIYSIQVPMLGLRLYWAFTERLFIFSPFPSALRAPLRLSLHDEQPALSEEAGFREIIDEYRGASMVSGLRSANGVQYSLRTFLSVLETIQKFMESDGAMPDLEDFSMTPLTEKSLALVPDKELMDRYFKGVLGTIIQVDEEGAYYRIVIK